MKVAVWDTYVIKENGNTIHFDILVPDDLMDIKTVYSYGIDYLSSLNIISKSFDSKECNFCHIEEATEDMVTAIKEKGYYIIEMEGYE
ncbi:DUF2024 family protein [Flavobacterium sp. '19STA2R22 D10 B1']|uniref:DUF2024 family protein n=1 Tax=Flavobacterium aerium TaxID=3037261 RepID=UPI00278BD10A|nr:DUF2024 family protein [Flavobacterium sp. '19STA2R22 D10 B1']